LNETDSKEVFKFVIDTHKALSQILRFSTIPTINKQNVAEHSYFVSLIAWLICTRLESNGVIVNTDQVLKMCLIHDIPESVSGDMPRNVKQGEVRNMIARLEDSVFEVMTENLPDDMKLELTCSYQMCGEKDYLEYRIMKFADILESAIYCLCEREMGNTNFESVIDKMISSWLDEFEESVMRGLTTEYKRRVKCEE